VLSDAKMLKKYDRPSFVVTIKEATVNNYNYLLRLLKSCFFCVSAVVAVDHLERASIMLEVRRIQTQHRHPVHLNQ
jgi:hypothetical protein